jgi:hypothetical protein
VGAHKFLAELGSRQPPAIDANGQAINPNTRGVRPPAISGDMRAKPICAADASMVALFSLIKPEQFGRPGLLPRRTGVAPVSLTLKSADQTVRRIKFAQAA